METPPSPQPDEIERLIEAIQGLPPDIRSQLEPLAKEAERRRNARMRIVSMAADAIAQLRLDSKYLIFDLEATRRERDEYLRQLEER